MLTRPPRIQSRIGEPTESVLAKGHKGIVKFRVEVAGKAAHSGYPELGVSAIDNLIEILYTLKHLVCSTDVTL
ncbi:hypothetical protein BC937DRAFT_88519 [Endogone sp. FLAS-F59071]|nr:hypothetical protein BC937DRAFT_88519 [Endogone sp. FLAS-F59071]|eukprot:RUS22555.1 hypothetical protein BC937DRAFT_88519 [Endogone sp. FLAS-F59071]